MNLIKFFNYHNFFFAQKEDVEETTAKVLHERQYLLEACIVRVLKAQKTILHADLIQAMVDYQSQSTSNASSISQWAAVAAIESGEAELQKSLGELKVRRDHAVKRIAEMPKLDLANPEGAFYLWLGVDQLFGTHCNGTPVTNSKAVSEILLDQYLVSTVPGVEFGFEGYIRLSYVVSMTELNKALDRLQKFASECKAL